jgi:hypothetical protein
VSPRARRLRRLRREDRQRRERILRARWNPSEPTGYVTDRCDEEVFERGRVVFITQTARAVHLEAWCRRVRTLSGQRVDWSWFAGRAVFRAIGDLDRVRWALWSLRNEHDDAYRREVNKMGLWRNKIGREDTRRRLDGIWAYNKRREWEAP